MADLKYGRVQVEHGDIPEDEPVFVLRAQDMASTHTLSDYYSWCVAFGSDQAHLDAIHKTRIAFETWQNQYPTKTPDTQLPLFGDTE